MNAGGIGREVSRKLPDFQNPLPLPRPKVRSPLTITVTSTLMSAPVRPAQRPLVAPKPRPQSSPHLLQEQLHPPPGLRNGDLSYCDAVIEDVHETIKDEEGCEEGVHVGDEEEKKEETDKRGETSDCSEDTVKADDITEDENTEKCLTKPGGAAQTDHERISTPPDKMEDGCGGEEEELSFTASDAEEENLHQTQSLFQNENFLHDDLFNELQSRGLAFGFTLLPTVTEEYPYDVIGKTDDASDTCESSDPTETGDTEVWQPERATKDLSGCFRFTSSTEDVFGPYSVIEAFSGHVNETVDPEWCQDDTEETSSAVNEKLSPEVSHQEPYYVTSDDVEKLEDEQSLSEKAGNDQDSVRNQLRDQAEDGESVNEYADIDDSLSPKADDLSECASSEDYVEIGEEDDNSETEKKHDKRKIIKEKTAKREKTFLNQRRSCQPRLRLCNITVPIDLDLGRTPELTNRVVFAHTTEAFEEDIEELDCHIVPYYEDSDSDSEEHIYEEPVFDSEGENIPLERKTIVSRSRSYSGKVSGYVPETVPEETGSEYQTHDYCTVPLDQSREGLSHSPKTGNCGIPSVKSRRFLLYSRSAESPELSWSPSTSTSLKDELVVKRKDDSLSLPCVVSSSGSFSQRSHQSSSGISTPTSLVDIPPPFELAYITKKAVTKSSPSLLIQHEPSDTPKKKKSSFKRFLALKFKRKSDSKGFSDGSVRSSRSSSESSHHGAVRAIELDRRSTGSSPPLQSLTVKAQKSPLELSSTFVFSKDLHKRKGDANYCSKSISRVESFVERSRHSVLPLPMTKPRSISFPSADTSDYENIPALSSDYENIQVPGRPTRSHTVTEFFENPNRSAAPCNENDGYVDMNSFSGIDGKTQPSILDTESAYTEPLPLMRHCDGPPVDEDHGRTSEEEEGAAEQSFDRQIDGRSRAFFIAKDLVDSEKTHVKTLKHIQEDFRCAVLMAVDDEGDPVLEEQRLEEILGKLPQAVSFHRSLLEELEERVRQWTERPKVLDVFLSRRDEFGLFESFIAEFDRSVFLLEESCRVNPAFARIVRKFEMAASEESDVPLKHQLMQVVVRVLQYRMLFTDYLNNLSPDCQEYEDTQAALLIVSALADQANDNLKHGENLLRLVHIEYSLKGKRDLLKPGRMFVKEGTLMKVSRKSRQPRHLFLMNDIVLYTFPQQDGKYRLKNTLPLSGMKVSKPVLDDVLNSLRIEVSDITITLSASSAGEREDWFHTLSRALADHAAGLSTFRPSLEASERLWMAVGEAAPVMVPVSHVMMCMNCTCDFSLTLRRHHCNACGKVVCRSCSRNKFPLKFLKDRMAKVCDQCYVQLRNKGGGLPLTGGNTSPRPHGSGRPLSSVLQSLQTPNLWRTRKSSASLSQVCLSGEGSSISGGLQRRKKSNRKWKRLWFLLKDQVLYTFSGCEDKAPAESLPLRGFSVHPLNGDDSSNVFHLYHNKTLYYSFKAEDPPTARRWVNALEEATVL